MNINIIIKFTITIFLILNVSVFADERIDKDLRIISFIVRNNVLVIHENKKVFPLRIEGNGKINTGNESSVGITLTMPLYDKREDKEREEKIMYKTEEIRKIATETLTKYREVDTKIKELTSLVEAKERYLKWMDERVKAGIDYLKEYQQKYIEILNDKKEIALLKENKETILLKLLSLITENKRDELIALLNK